MSIHLPEKRYLTFEELTNRWQCDRTDLLHLIIGGKLRPSFWVDGTDCRPAVDDQDEPLDPPESGWFYLQGRSETGPYECEFAVVSKARDVDPWDFEGVYSLYRPID